MGVLDEMKEIGDLIKKAGDIELYRKIVKLEGEVTELTRDKRRAEEKNEELQRALKFKTELEFREPFYWLKGDSVPYCPVCWEDKTKAVHIVYSHRNSHGEYWDCKTCRSSFTTHGIANKPY
jgi:hypothetical protein